MKELLNASFFISGTAIGAGLLALPLTAANLGIDITSIMILGMAWVAYYSSMMTIDLNETNQKPTSIVELSRKFSGIKAFHITLSSFYVLSLALLTAYFSSMIDTLSLFFAVDYRSLASLCALGLFCILRLNLNIFSKLNFVFVAILLIIIAMSMLNIYTTKHTPILTHLTGHLTDMFAFFPIIFTSFGIQNICPQVYEYLKGDRKKISKAFMLGILIPVITYIIVIYCIFQNILARDTLFFVKLQNHEVSVGALINFLCESSHSKYIHASFKLLSLFAVMTSAIGMGLGLQKSIQEITKVSKTFSSAITCIIPLVLVFLIPNVFIPVLSFGGMIATIFVIFIPYFLLHRRNIQYRSKIAYGVCFVVGLIIIICELLPLLKTI